jgi:hypothetical protein
METPLKESQIIMALELMKRDPSLSVRRVAALYGVPRTTLTRRRSGTPSRRDSPPNSTKLIKIEEETIVRYILDLDARSYPPRLSKVKDLANILLTERKALRVGLRWASAFIKREPRL